MPVTKTMPRLIAVLFLAMAAGCATLQDPIRANLSAPDAEIAHCAAWYRTLEENIDRAGVRDAGEYRIPGFPYLRVDRFTASFRTGASAGESGFRAWTDRLRRLESEARAAELRNLPAAVLADLGVDRGQAGEKTQACAATLAGHDFASPERRRLLLDRAQVPDDYLTWQRVLGLYPVSRVPFSFGVEGWHKEAVETFRRSKEGALGRGAVTRYVPAAAATWEPARRIVAQARTDPLGIPEFSDSQREALFAAFAPVIEVETTGDFDRIGALAWTGEGPAPGVDTSRPLVYRKLAYTRYGGRTLVQLVYVAWFSERPHDTAFDMLAGRIDGIVWRVTLDPGGEPLVYDSIHPCGCFHMFFPVAGVEVIPAPGKMIEWAFAPAQAPQVPAEGRLAIRLATRTHYMVAIAPDSGDAGQPYAFADYDDLRSMSTAGGQARSAFRPGDGLMPGTERGERAFFWPMGVPSAGAMRQWGHHATAFLGRRHFDDADLIERRFRIPQQ